MILTIKRRFVIWTALVLFLLAGISFLYIRQDRAENMAIQAMSWVVAGRTFIIDPGHGGEDPGKVGLSGVLEKDINLAVALKLNAILNQGGGRVILTRDKDVALSGNQDTVRERKRADLNTRVGIAEKMKANLFLSLHCNSFPSGRWSGAQTFYAPDVAGSKELATSIQAELTSFPGNTTRLPRPDLTSLIFKRAKMPIVNIEMGFLSNSQEEKLLQDAAYQDKLAWSIYAGVVKYLLENGEQYQPTISGADK